MNKLGPLYSWLYSMYDKLMKQYLPPFEAANDEVAGREFLEHLDDRRFPFHKHPGDYMLYRVGQHDAESGVLVTEELPVCVHEGIGVPGIPQQADLAQQQQIAAFSRWLQQQAANGADVRALLEKAGANQLRIQ